MEIYVLIRMASRLSLHRLDAVQEFFSLGVGLSVQQVLLFDPPISAVGESQVSPLADAIGNLDWLARVKSRNRRVDYSRRVEHRKVFWRDIGEFG